MESSIYSWWSCWSNYRMYGWQLWRAWIVPLPFGRSSQFSRRKVIQKTIFVCSELILNIWKPKKILKTRPIENSIWNNFEKCQFEKYLIPFTELPTTQFHFQMQSRSWLTAWLTEKWTKTQSLKRIFTMNWSNSWEKWRLVLWWTRTYIFKGLCCDSLYSLCYIDCSLYCFKTRLLKTRLGSPKTNTCINLALSSNYRGASCTCGGWKKSLDIWPKWFWKSVPIFGVRKCIL